MQNILRFEHLENSDYFVMISRYLLPTSEPLKMYKGFYESLQIAFPNNVLVSQFRGWSLQSAVSPQKRGAGSANSLAFKATWTRMAYWK